MNAKERREALLQKATKNLSELPINFPFDGRCGCGEDLIERYAWQLTHTDGYKITGCPGCHRSFC